MIYPPTLEYAYIIGHLIHLDVKTACRQSEMKD